MQKECTQCSAQFEVTDEDLKFYDDVSPIFNGKKESIPPPTLCPDCRQQRRLTFRNFFHLYNRTCDLTSKEILSAYHPSCQFPVYDQHAWWGDEWDGLMYGIEPDFSRPFFEQLQELHTTVPRLNVVNSLCENCDFCNMSMQSRNCYLVFGNVLNEDCCYGHIVWKSKDCFDCLYVYQSERCLECIDCVDCYEVAYSRASEGCTNSLFLVHCNNCSNCFGCVGLKNKEYHMFNESLSKEEYEKRLQEFNHGSASMIEMAHTKTQELVGKEIVKHYHGIQCEDVTGDYLYNCKNARDSFDLKNCEDSRFLATLDSFNHSYDCDYSARHGEWMYEILSSYGNNVLMCHNGMNDCSNTIYCDNCFACKDCFGCCGLKSKQYCIFNKQYSKQEYEELAPKLIAHMRSTGEWGEFFPVPLSPFGYNETMAYEYYPLSQKEVESSGWQWRDDEEVINAESSNDLPDDIKNVPDDICEQILTCESTSKNYKIIPQELTFHREMNLPLPRTCFLQRHRDRMALRNPRKLFSRQCDKCKKDIETTYSPERPEKVYCEECYLAEVY